MIVHPRARDGAALAHVVERALARARRRGRPQIARCAIALEHAVDAIGWWSAGRSRFGEAVYLSDPPDRPGLAERSEWCALGAVRELRASGGQPAAQLAAALHELRADLVASPGLPATLPLVVGGCAFDPLSRREPDWAAYPAGRLVVPRVLAGGTTLIVAIDVAPNDDPAALLEAATADLARASALAPSAPPSAVTVTDCRSEPADWAQQVALTAAEVRAGRFSKLVLARRERIGFEGVFDLAAALGHLRDVHAGASVFAFGHGPTTFLGASPERLVRLHDGRFAIDALAGSGPRGATPGEDARRAAELLASAKNRREHAVVVEAVETAIADVCSELDVPGEPSVRATTHVNHLWTPLRGRVAPGRGVLDLVGRLHPTPAVAGWPRAEAALAIGRRERFDRGWYAGPVGWVDAIGDGAFAVAIRSALVGSRQALLYAGCGIVGESEPSAEADEAALKLRTMTTALGLDG